MRLLDIDKPRIVISALKGKTGKTLTSILIALSLVIYKKLKVQMFKIGPDFIDPTYHSAVTGRPSRNLDPYLHDPQRIIDRFITYSNDSDIAIIEGVFGLYDIAERSSKVGETERIAEILKAPIILVVDAERTNRTIAKIAKKLSEDNKNIRGIIVTGIVKEAQYEKIREELTDSSNIELLGYIPKRKSIEDIFRYRHLGLVPTLEKGYRENILNILNELTHTLDIDRIVDIACRSETVRCIGEFEKFEEVPHRVNIGIVFDRAFTFYYPETLELCVNYSEKLYLIDSARTPSIPNKLDILIIGGGFPEVLAEEISRNRSLRASIRRFHEKDGLIYAECGGLMYLTDFIVYKESQYDMCQIFEGCTYMLNRPVGHGYVLAEITERCPLGYPGYSIRGHEFHHSKIYLKDSEARTYMKILRGRGLGDGRDGLAKRETYAQYMHIHPSSYNHIYRLINYATSRGYRYERQ